MMAFENPEFDTVIAPNNAARLAREIRDAALAILHKDLVTEELSLKTQTVHALALVITACNGVKP